MRISMLTMMLNGNFLDIEQLVQSQQYLKAIKRQLPLIIRRKMVLHMELQWQKIVWVGKEQQGQSSNDQITR